MFVKSLVTSIVFAWSAQCFCAANALSIPTNAPKPTLSAQRSVFMNGVDISSSRNQDLRNVHLRIDEHGNLFITAPHYQVTEEETYTPLSSYHHTADKVEHKPPQERPQNRSAPTADSAIAQPVPVSDAAESPPKTVLPENPASPQTPK